LFLGESSSAAAARPAGGFRADYGFVATVDREIMPDPEREVGYGITDPEPDNSGVRRTERAARECTCTDFLKCQPLPFKGTEGFASLSQWCERMESVFYINNCTAENQVKFATFTLHSTALTWMFFEEADKIEKYVRGLPDMIHESVVASKPKRMQEAIEIATELMDKKVRTFAERETASKRKLENTSRTTRNQQQQQHSNKRQNTG
nr:reverse transcriptase domain-containing protein [Tanacetum cinerariifolium]